MVVQILRPIIENFVFFKYIYDSIHKKKPKTLNLRLWQNFFFLLLKLIEDGNRIY